MLRGSPGLTAGQLADIGSVMGEVSMPLRGKR